LGAKERVMIKEFTRADFDDRQEPYEFCYKFKDNEFQHAQVISKLSEQALKLGIKNFKTMYKSFVKEKKKEETGMIGNVTNFEGELEYSSGKWFADDTGISTIDSYGVDQYACVHPIFIKERLVNIDTGHEKVNIAFSRLKKASNRWKYIIVEKDVISSNNSIVKLSQQGVAVTSETAKLLVSYLHDFEHQNYETLPEKKCCSRLGWIEEEGFAPYCAELLFDGDVNMNKLFDSVCEKGSFKKWQTEIIKNCNFNAVNKIVIGASLAAPLIKGLGINNFFLHLWAETETAKSVSLMLAASIWANPQIGKYIQTFNSTNVGKERIAEVCNNLPIFFDELQIVTDRTQFDREIYELTEGAGRLRGNKFGGTDKTATWETCFLTNGEKPITSENSQGGAVNRIIEIECTEKLILDGKETCIIIKNNYGHAGKKYIEHIEENKDSIRGIFTKHYKELEKTEKTEKQTAIGAVILAAFEIASICLFDNEINLTLNEISNFLVSKKTVDVNERAYNYMMDFIGRNINKFKGKDNNEVFGKISDVGVVSIIKSVFDKMCIDSGFNSKSFLSWLVKKDKIRIVGDRKAIKVTINGVALRCVVLTEVINEDEPFESE
jgi:uncharacterized protein (DUF927 family)